MRGRSIKGSTRRRTEAREIVRRRQYGRLPQLKRKPRPRNAVQHLPPAPLDLLMCKGRAVAGGGRVDDDLDALGSRLGAARIAAILRTQIDGGRIGQPSGTKRVELGAIIVREKDVVPRQREAGAGRVGGPHHRAQRPAARAHPRGCARHAGSERPRADRGGIGGADDARRLDHLAAFEGHARRPTTPDADLGHPLAISAGDAHPLAQRRQRRRQPVHPAVDQPHPACLDMRDQHQRGGRGKG